MQQLIKSFKIGMSISFESLLKIDKTRRQNLIKTKLRLQRQEQKKAMTGRCRIKSIGKGQQKTSTVKLELCGATRKPRFTAGECYCVNFMVDG